MVIHQIQNLHLPMIIGAARDLHKRIRRGGLGRLAGPALGLEPILQRSQDDWWQRYVYDTTQGALRVIGARYGEGEYYPVDDPRYRPNINLGINPTLQTPGTTPSPTTEQGIKLTNTQILLGVAGLLLFMQGRKGR